MMNSLTAMNIQNISELSKQLEVLGFHDAGSLLLKRICFKPANFYLPQRVIKEKDVMLFSLYFELLQKTDNYRLQYYDVTLQKANGGLALPVDGVNPAELEKQMAGIDWKKALVFLVVIGGLIYITKAELGMTTTNSFLTTLGILLLLFIGDNFAQKIDDDRKRRKLNDDGKAN